MALVKRRYIMADRIQASNVISEWGFLVLGYEDSDQHYYKLVVDALRKHGWPYGIEKVEVGDGFFRLNPKPYLKTKAGKLVAYIGSETVGKDNIYNSYLNWSLTVADPGLFKKAIAAAGGFSHAVFQEFTFNEINSARAFATLVHSSVQEAVDAILDDRQIDKSKMSRSASGILGGLL
jgi:hypothetical protein